MSAKDGTYQPTRKENAYAYTRMLRRRTARLNSIFLNQNCNFYRGESEARDRQEILKNVT